MNKRSVWAIAQKDIRSITSNIQVWLPMLIVPVIFSVVLPTVLLIAFWKADPSQVTNSQQIAELARKLIEGPLRESMSGLNSLNQQFAYLFVNYFFAPLFLIIPLMAASVVAANSFVGEKERGTLESLLFSPVDITSLFVGKVLSALIPALAASLGSFVLYGLTANLAGWPLFGRIFFPAPNWWPLILWVMPMISLTAILFNVIISARVSDFQAAYQLGALVILPVMLLFAGQLAGILLTSTLGMLAVGLVLALINGAMLRIIVFHFDRNRLFESQVR